MSISTSRSLFATGFCLSVAASSASAQQFQYQPGLIPGALRWTEGVEAADVDNDGDLDLFFAEGDGFASPGAQRQNVLVINQFAGSGTLSYTNESVARLGVHLSNAKGVATGDINGDGYTDAIFANAFNTDPPFLYINQAAGNPGFFTEDGAARGLTEILSSAGAGFGDLDDDGDLDLILNDVGGSFLGGAGDRPNLYINDGNGNFTEKTGPGWNPSVKKAQMDVQLVDVDNDMDLDFVGYCRASNSGGNHYLMLNDGNANFTESSSLLPDGSTSSYEAELGDLDGDSDLDIFMVSLSGFREGAVRNNLLPSGSLTFTAQPPLALQQDDNEIALCDIDNDGDLDVAVGSLGTKERFYRNDGAFSFTNVSAEITTQGDSTLDCTFADLDNDGDYDFITAQGESNSAQWVSKVYINNGPADTIAPRVLADAAVGSLASDTGPWVGRVKIQDSVIDDGRNYVTGSAHYVVLDNPVSTAVDITAGGFSPNSFSIAAGSSVVFTNTSGANQSVTSTTVPYTYNSGNFGPGQSYELALVRPGVYQIISTPSGATCTVTVTGAAQSVDSTYSGGGIYRSAMLGNAAAPNARLVYEHEFIDWAGNVRVTDAQVALKQTSVGTPFCSGDGSGTACPCGNAGSAGAGCANSASATGAVLAGLGVATVGADSVVLEATDCPPNKPGIFFQGVNQAAGGNGAPFGDGLLCAAGQIVRLETVFTNAAGLATSTVSLSVSGAVNPGDSRSYQYWFRDPAGSPCGNGFNTTNGLQVIWN